MAKRTPSDNARIPQRGPTGHGAPYNSEQRENPVVHSKGTRRYGTDGSRGDFPNSSTGQQPARIQPGFPPSVRISREVMPGIPRGHTVGFTPDGSGKHIRPDHPMTGHSSGSLHTRASTVGAKGMADKAK